MKSDKYNAVTERIVEQLERGCAPWVRPWVTTGISDFPTNISSERHYRGANVLTLWIAQAACAYPTAEWLTFKQARELGGKVRKGEHGSAIFYASTFEKIDETPAGDERARSIAFMKSFTVFNVAQCEGLPERTSIAALTPFERIRNADAFVRAIGADVRHGGDAAFFSPGTDSITLPLPEAFVAPEHYYGTSFHEHGHWTGAKHRLDRQFGKRFGDSAYAFEELVAELTSAFVCAQLAIPCQLRHPEYLAHWVSILKGDAQAIWTASARATEAAAYLCRLAGHDVAERSEDVAA
jgi:antirestriction protein ArdC